MSKRAVGDMLGAAGGIAFKAARRRARSRPAAKMVATPLRRSSVAMWAAESGLRPTIDALGMAVTSE